MRTLILVMLVMLSGVASAQNAPGVSAQLTLDEDRLLARGYISKSQHMWGGAASVIFGFGAGQYVQDRKGTIFTLGQLGGLGVMVVGSAMLLGGGDDGSDDVPHAVIGVGIVGFGVFRIWEIVDAFSGPTEHNRRLRDLRGRLGYRDGYAVRPFVAPTGNGGGVAGVGFSF